MAAARLVGTQRQPLGCCRDCKQEAGADHDAELDQNEPHTLARSVKKTPPPTSQTSRVKLPTLSYRQGRQALNEAESEVAHEDAA
jgi:hypothetical protein